MLHLCQIPSLGSFLIEFSGYSGLYAIKHYVWYKLISLYEIRNSRMSHYFIILVTWFLICENILHLSFAVMLFLACQGFFTSEQKQLFTSVYYAADRKVVPSPLPISYLSAHSCGCLLA